MFIKHFNEKTQTILLYTLIIFSCFCMANIYGEDLSFAQNIKLQGDLARRIALTQRRLQSHPFAVDFVVQDVARVPEKKRRFEEYEGDVSGRVLGAWSFSARLLGERPEKLDKIAQEVLKYQKPEGYFGTNQEPEGWDFWGRQNFGHGRLLVGLVEYYKLSHDKRFLQAAEKLGGYFVRSVPRWTTTHADNPWTDTSDKIDWQDYKSNRRHFVKTHQTSILEGLMLLYELKPRQEYLETGRKIVELFPAFGQYHSHSYLNTMTGIAMLYRHTGQKEYLDLLENLYWQHIRLLTDRADDSVCEFYPMDERTEGCSVVDWLRLNLQLWRITRRADYIERAEGIWLNSLNFHQTADGAFGHATISPFGYDKRYDQAWWCCLMHGLFAYAEIVENIAASENENLWINFYTPATCQLKWQNTDLQLQVKTQYPSTGDIAIALNPQQPISGNLRLRIPHWVDNCQVNVNGQALEAARSQGELVISRIWQKGDQVMLKFPVGLRLEGPRGVDLLAIRTFGDQPRPANFFHGPMILGADLHWNKEFPVYITYKRGQDYHCELPQTQTFTIAHTHYKLPAQFQQQGEVILVPIAEFTNYGTWDDQFAGFVRNSSNPIERPLVQVQQLVKVVR